MKKLLSALTLVLLAVGSAAAQDQDAAEAAALTWLSYVDDGEYVTSWSSAGAPFQKQLTPQAWEGAVSAAREPLGALRVRKLKAAERRTSLPGAPDGEYVVMQFDSAFTNKAAAVETVTTVLEGGSWRVVGYFIR